MGIRRKRKDRILAGQQQSRIDNGHLKRAEARASRRSTENSGQEGQTSIYAAGSELAERQIEQAWPAHHASRCRHVSQKLTDYFDDRAARSAIRSSKSARLPRPLLWRRQPGRL